MALTPEEIAALFPGGDPSDDPFNDDPSPTPPPAPVKSSKLPITDVCVWCKVELTLENSSRQKHIGCPLAQVAPRDVAAVLPPDAPASDPKLAAEPLVVLTPVSSDAPTKRHRRTKAEMEAARGLGSVITRADPADVTVSAPMVVRHIPDAPLTITVELGPETLAALARLLKP